VIGDGNGRMSSQKKILIARKRPLYEKEKSKESKEEEIRY